MNGMKKIVISLGGNALDTCSTMHSAAEQLSACFQTAKTVVNLAMQGFIEMSRKCVYVRKVTKLFH